MTVRSFLKHTRMVCLILHRPPTIMIMILSIRYPKGTTQLFIQVAEALIHTLFAENLLCASVQRIQLCSL